ncbi:MAG: signal peptidase II [Lentisphaeria bacterium]|nr:signal peptidase II [Lentisphaeria bacterium]
MKKNNWLTFYRFPLITILFLVIFDQVTKWVIVKNVALNGQKIEVITNHFDIVHVKNPGAAWGMFGDHTWALAILSFVASVVMIGLFKKLAEERVSQAIAISLIIGGTIGNFIDRAFLAEVTDFLSFHWYNSYYFPAFNVADSAISIGVFIYIICSLVPSKLKNDEAETEVETTLTPKEDREPV